MDYLKLCRNGVLKYYDTDDEKVELYNYHQKGDKFRVINRKTKETIALVDSEEEAMMYRMTERPIKHIVAHLRRGLVIEAGLTVGDFLNLIESHEELEYLVSSNFPVFNGQYPVEGNRLAIRRRAVAENGRFEIETILDGFGGVNHNPEAAIEFDKNTDLVVNGQVVYTGERFVTLLDLIYAVFSPWHDETPVVLTRQGLFQHGEQVDEVIGKFFNKIELAEENYTLRDFFQFVIEREDFKDFISQYSWCRSIDDFHAELNKPIEPNEFAEKIHYAQISHLGKAHSVGKNHYVDWDSDFVGIGEVGEDTKKWCEQDDRPVPEFDRYGLSCTPISEIAHLPLKVEPKITLYKDRKYTRKGGLEGEEIEYGDFNYQMTLGDFFDVIYDDISFYGGPVERQEFLEEIDRRMDDVKSGKEETFPMEDLFDKLEKEAKEEFGEEYEGDDE